MTNEAMSPLRRRMIEDMTIRKLAPKTQQGYIRLFVLQSQDAWGVRNRLRTVWRQTHADLRDKSSLRESFRPRWVHHDRTTDHFV